MLLAIVSLEIVPGGLIPVVVQVWLAHCGHAHVLHGAQLAFICASNGFGIGRPCCTQPAPFMTQSRGRESLTFEGRP